MSSRPLATRQTIRLLRVLSANRFVPVAFDSNGVVSLNTVNRFRWNGNLNGQLASSTANGVCAADLVVAAGFHEIDEFSDNSWFAFPFGRRGAGRGILAFDAKSQNIFKPRTLATMRGDRAQQLVLSAEPIECCVGWERLISPRFTSNLTLNRKFSKLPYELDVPFNEDFIARS